MRAASVIPSARGAEPGRLRLASLLLLPLVAVFACCPRPSGRGPAGSGSGGEDSGAAGPARVVRAADGRHLGLLRKIDAFPLYEFRYEADYDLGSLLGVSFGAGGAVGGATGGMAAREVGGFACTCFAARNLAGHRVMGRNFDWDPDPVLVLLTRPSHGHASIALVDIRYLGFSRASPPEENPAGLAGAPAIPFDGVNDEGLAVGMMAVPHAEGMGAVERPTVDELGFIRLVLDRAGSVGEAMELAAACNVRFGSVPLHYFVADPSGASVVIEFAGGKVAFFRGGGDWQVSTNFLFSEIAEDKRMTVCWRYASAAAELATSRGLVDPLALLARVSQANTLWSSVYDLHEASLELALGGRWSRILTWRIGP